MSDDERPGDPLAAARALPRGSMVVLRARDGERLLRLATALLKIARRNAVALLIAGDPPLAARLGADGIHLGEARAGETAYWRARFPTLLITTAAHSPRAVWRARLFGADAVFLSPVFATPSHPARAPLTPARANLIARGAGLPVYALGGIDARNAVLLAPGAYAGIAAIGALRA